MGGSRTASLQQGRLLMGGSRTAPLQQGRIFMGGIPDGALVCFFTYASALRYQVGEDTNKAMRPLHCVDLHADH